MEYKGTAYCAKMPVSYIQHRQATGAFRQTYVTFRKLSGDVSAKLPSKLRTNGDDQVKLSDLDRVPEQHLFFRVIRKVLDRFLHDTVLHVFISLLVVVNIYFPINVYNEIAAPFIAHPTLTTIVDVEVFNCSMTEVNSFLQCDGGFNGLVMMLLLLLSGDVEVNPGPDCPDCLVASALPSTTKLLPQMQSNNSVVTQQQSKREANQATKPCTDNMRHQVTSTAVDITVNMKPTRHAASQRGTDVTIVVSIKQEIMDTKFQHETQQQIQELHYSFTDDKEISWIAVLREFLKSFQNLSDSYSELRIQQSLNKAVGHMRHQMVPILTNIIGNMHTSKTSIPKLLYEMVIAHQTVTRNYALEYSCYKTENFEILPTLEPQIAMLLLRDRIASILDVVYKFMQWIELLNVHSLLEQGKAPFTHNRTDSMQEIFRKLKFRKVSGNSSNIMNRIFAVFISFLPGYDRRENHKVAPNALTLWKELYMQNKTNRHRSIIFILKILMSLKINKNIMQEPRTLSDMDKELIICDIVEFEVKKTEKLEYIKLPCNIQYLKLCIQVCLFSFRIQLHHTKRNFILPNYFYNFRENIYFEPHYETLVYPILVNYLERMANGPPLKPGEEFCCEAVRIESFQKFPRWAPVSAVKLAKSGFSFTGHGDEVLCFSCGGRLRSWHYGDEPNVRHRQTFPNCNFMNGRDTSNIPLGGSSNQSVDRNDFDVPQSDSRSGSNPHNYYNDLARNTGNTSIRDEDDPLRAEELRMKIERNRLQTYTGWPASAPVFPDELSRNGFYYTGVDDRVQCAFCRGILRHWEPGDRVDIEHRHYFPDCGFVRAEDVGNVPLGSELSADSSEPVTVNINTGADILSDPQNAAILGINTDRPKNPFYALLQHRLGTYETWPTTMRQRPEQLADAGFYYAGFSDNVKCFFCDGGLRNWEPDDDPWTEHARWFPRCGYVRREKGEGFIRGISEHYARFYPEETHSSRAGEEATPVVNITGPDTQAALTNLPGVDYMVEPREIKARMDTDKVRTVLGMGYSRTVVRKALEIQLRTKGDDFPNAYSLLEAIFKLEANQGTPESSGLPAGASNVPETTAKNHECKETPKKKSMHEAETENVQNALQSNISSHESESIVEENQKLKEERTCKICMDANVNVVFLPCGHLVSCQECAQSLRNCPICRSTIRGTVKTYMS